MSRLQQHIARFEQMQVTLTGILVIAVALFLLGVDIPTQLSHRCVIQDIDQAQATLRSAELREHAMAAALGQTQSLTLAISRAKQIPPTLRLGQWLGEVSSLAAQHAMQHWTLQQQTPQCVGACIEQPVTLNAHGRFLDCLAFVQSLEAMPRLTRVQDLSITADPANDGVDLQLTASLYAKEAP